MSCAYQPKEEKKLLSLEFLLLFFQATCCNCCIAVFYCMEQWMLKLSIVPATRGLLIAVLAIALFISRPLVTWFLYGKNKTWALLASILVTALTLLAYLFIKENYAVPIIFVLRAIQGFFLAIYSSCTTSLLVECIPQGQSARGFAIFSLTLLIPYAIIPALGEGLILFFGGEAQLFAATSLLLLPALATVPFLRKILSVHIQNNSEVQKNRAQMWKSLHPKQLGLIYIACLTFSIMTTEAIFFMKGLCTQINAVPAYFFTTYTSTIMVIRLLANKIFDSFPRYPIMLVTAFLLALCTKMMSTSHGYELIVLSVLYGSALGLLYPLLASVVCDRSSAMMRPLNTNIMMAAFDLSNCLAPVIGGLILLCGFGYQGVFISTSVSISLCGLCIFFDMLIQAKKQKSLRI